MTAEKTSQFERRAGDAGASLMDEALNEMERILRFGGVPFRDEAGRVVKTAPPTRETKHRRYPSKRVKP